MTAALNGQWLRRARHFRGMTAKQLAEQAGLSLNYVQRLEKGDRNASATAAEKLCDALGFTPESVPLDSRGLLAKIDQLIDEHGPYAFCTMRCARARGNRYYTDCEYFDINSIKTGKEPAPDHLLRLAYAKTEAETQQTLWETGPDIIEGAIIDGALQFHWE